MKCGVAINYWYAPFYDLIQSALATPHSVSISQFYHEIGISRHRADCGGDWRAGLLRQPLCVPWRTAMNEHYGTLAASAPY